MLGGGRGVLVHWLSGMRGARPPGRLQGIVAVQLAAALLGFPILGELSVELRPHGAISRFVGAVRAVVVVGALTVAVLAVCEGGSVFDALWQTWQTATTVGYGDRPFTTPAGKIAAMLLGTLDIVLVGHAISAAFGVKEHMRDLRRYGRMPNPEDQAYVIVHWPGERDMRLLVRGLRATDPDAPICVVDGRLEELPVEIRTLPKIHYVRGSALNPVVLERAGVQTSKAVILFASDKSDPDTDAATLTVAKQLWRVPGRFRLCYFLVESQNERLFAGEFDDAADLGRPHPAAVPRHLATMAAVQAARSSRVGDTITGLLRPDSGPMLHAGHTGAAAPARWSRLVSVVQRIAEELDVAVNPVSLSRAGGDEASVCPRPTDLVLPEDQVVFSAAQGVDWASFHAMLADRLDAG